MKLTWQKFVAASAIWLAGAGIACWVPSAIAQTTTFDFDTATPALVTGQNVPFDQTIGGVTAQFSAASGGFSVQNYQSTSIILSQFSGNYIYPNGATGVLVMQFSRAITNVVMDFATAEATPNETPNIVQLTAYTNSIATPQIGSVTNAGKYIGINLMPMGILTFQSAVPFDVVKLELLPGLATGILVDNIAVQIPGGVHINVTATAFPADGGTTSGGGSYLIGAPVTVTASPNPGFVFVDWTENGLEVSTMTDYSFTADADHTLVANFVQTFTLTTSASPANGGTTAGDGIYNSGSTAYVEATPNPGFAFVNWSVNGVPFDTWPYCFFTVNSNETLVANFATACTVTTSSSSPAGSASGGGAYAMGATINVMAVPNTGFSFANWTENGMQVSTSASYTFTGAGDRALVANFTTNDLSVTFDFDSGTPTLTTLQTTPFDQTAGGLTAQFTSTNGAAYSVESDANTGWILSRFSSNYLAPVFAMSVLDIQFSQPVTNIALGFATLDYQKILAPSTIELAAYPSSTADSPLGTTSAQGTYTPGDSMPMGALAFSSATPFQAVRIWIPPTPQGAQDFIVDNITVQKSGIITYTITASVSPGGAGTISGSGVYTNNASVTLTAVANPGYAFLNWTENDSPISSALSITFTATANRTLVANFVQTWDIAASANPAAAGVITGANTYTNNASVTLTAAANPGYAFLNWTENGSPVSSALSLTFTATANRTLVANFVQTWNIAATANPTDGGLITGANTYTNNASVNLTAAANPGYAFLNWTEGGTSVSSAAAYTFTASTNRTLVANFTIIPTVQISVTSTNTVLISWAAGSTGFILQENPAFDPAAWADTTNKVDVIGGQNQVVEMPWAGTRFFRLYHP